MAATLVISCGPPAARNEHSGGRLRRVARRSVVNLARGDGQEVGRRRGLQQRWRLAPSPGDSPRHAPVSCPSDKVRMSLPSIVGDTYSAIAVACQGTQPEGTPATRTSTSSLPARRPVSRSRPE
jgi:hypothetical protein